MTSETFRIELEDGSEIEARRTRPAAQPTWLFVYSPGAGSNIHDPFGKYLSGQLESANVACVRFQFPYMEARKRGPDRPPVLEATWRAVIDAVREPSARLCVGGRSMGGRIGSQVVASGIEADAVALFAYPLHPPGKPEKRRDAHLVDLAVPVLFCSGDRDAFGTTDELGELAKAMPNARHRILPGADHGFNVRKSDGRTREDVWEEASATFVDWLEELT